MAKHLPSDIPAATIAHVCVPPPAKDEILALSECSVYAACHSFLKIKFYIQDNIKARTLIGGLLPTYTYTTWCGVWQDPSLEVFDLLLLPKNENTYTEVAVRSVIIKGLWRT